MLGRILPFHVMEVSHFLASAAGAGLLLLAQGLARRLDGAYYLASALLVFGIAASMLKGFDYEEATLLLIVLAILWRSRRAFNRRAAFVESRSPPPGFAAVLLRSSPPSGSACSRFDMSSTRAISGGSSSCTLTRRASCARRSALPSSWRSSDSHG